MNLKSILDQYTSSFNFLGYTGMRQLERVVRTLSPDYGNLEEFFYDNPGAIEAVIEWIGKQNVSEWKENILLKIDLVDEDSDYDSD